jgi:hypothetical protein
MAWIILDRYIGTPAVVEKSNDFHWDLGRSTLGILSLELNILHFGLLAGALRPQTGLSVSFGI